MESQLAEDDWIRAGHDCLQRGAAGAFLALVLLGTVRMAFGIVRMLSLGIVRVVYLGIGEFRIMRMLVVCVLDRLPVV